MTRRLMASDFASPPKLGGAQSHSPQLFRRKEAALRLGNMLNPTQGEKANKVACLKS